MFAMHYEFVLPADYDMRSIRDRVAARGHLFDGTESLLFKAFLIADRAAGAPVNRYAPVYVWTRTDAAWTFIGGPLFAALTGSFGRPRVMTGLVAACPSAEAVARATVLWRRTVLPALRTGEPIAEQLAPAGADTLSWLDPGGWSQTSMVFGESEADPGEGERLEILHLARGSDWGAA